MWLNEPISIPFAPIAFPFCRDPRPAASAEGGGRRGRRSGFSFNTYKCNFHADILGAAGSRSFNVIPPVVYGDVFWRPARVPPHCPSTVRGTSRPAFQVERMAAAISLWSERSERPIRS